jgi:hypothetical protein
MSVGEVRQIPCEPRACPHCVKKRIKCVPLGLRPCESCIVKGREKECVEDATERKLACVPCRQLKKTCDRLLPSCTRCTQRGIQCVSFVTPSNPSKKRQRTTDSADSGSDGGESGDLLAVTKRSRQIGNLDHAIVCAEPEFWDKDATVRFVTSCFNDVSPMAVFDSLAMSFNKLSFFFFSLCKFIPPKDNMKLFDELISVVEETFPDLNIVAISNLKTRLRLLMHNCESLMRLEAASACIPLDSASALIPALSHDAPKFAVSEVQELSKFIVKFQELWDAKYPDVKLGTPGVCLNKVGIDGKFEFYMNEVAEEIIGVDLFQMNSMLFTREERDREWKAKHPEIEGHQLVTGSFW